MSKFALNSRLDGSNSTLFVNAKRKVVFKAKDSEITPYKTCLGNVFADFNATNAQKAELHGNIFDFSVKYMTFTGT